MRKDSGFGHMVPKGESRSQVGLFSTPLDSAKASGVDAHGRKFRAGFIQESGMVHIMGISIGNPRSLLIGWCNDQVQRTEPQRDSV